MGGWGEYGQVGKYGQVGECRQVGEYGQVGWLVAFRYQSHAARFLHVPDVPHTHYPPTRSHSERNSINSPFTWALVIP